MKHSKATKYLILAALALLCACAAFGGQADAVVDVTFFATTDVHYGAPNYSESARHTTIDFMNALPGTAYPASVGGGIVATPLGVTVTGDLTDHGYASEWPLFTQDYGINGEGRILFPVYELWGNHDGAGNIATSPISAGIKARTLVRPGVKKISTNGYHYSWEWGHVHFVSTNIYPGDVLIPDGVVDGPGHYPLYSLQFLKDDLRENVGDSGKPVIILMHLGLDSYGAGWWSTTEQDNFYNAIKDYNVIGIMQGHNHAAQAFTWRGFDVYSCPAGQRDPDPGECLVFHITQNRLTFAHRFSTNWGPLYVNKAIETRPKTMAYLKDLPDGAAVRLSGKRVTAVQGVGGVPAGVFYIEEPDRFMGIRIASSYVVAVGNTVTVVGTLGTRAGGERYISATGVAKTAGTALKPLAANSRTLSDPMMDGLLIRIAGKVKTVGSNYFTITDGFATESGGLIETTVKTGGVPGVAPDEFVTLTGIASKDGSRVILKVP